MTRFAYVPFGAPAPERSAACDGLVEGAALDLSHWPRNRTPPALKRDTSVEIALAFVAGGGHVDVAANNHFDTDGALAVFVLAEPDVARAHAPLLIAAAEAGDFEEWPADPRGLRLEAALRALAGEREGAAAYDAVLPRLPHLLTDLDAREDLWGDAWRALEAAEARARAGAVRVWSQGAIAVFEHAEGEAELPVPVLSKLAPAGASRWLVAFAERGAYRYRYQLPPWAWADTVVRPRLAAPRRNALADRLGPTWAMKGELGMTGLLRTSWAIGDAPAVVAERLAEREAREARRRASKAA